MGKARELVSIQVSTQSDSFEEEIVFFEDERRRKVSEHLNTFNDILSQLESIGVKMDDEDKAVTLLCTLPDSYDNLVTT